MFGIYRIICLVNQRVYIGSTQVSFKARFKKHKQRLRNNYHENEYLQRAWNKYGEENFRFEVLEEMLFNSLVKEREQYYLDRYLQLGKDKCFNLSPNSCGGNTLINDSIKEKHKQGLINSYTDELREKRREHGKKYKDSFLQNIKKITSTEEFKQKQINRIQEMCKTDKWLEANRKSVEKRREHGKTDKNELFESVTKAADVTGASRANIRACINGKIKSCMGRKWQYA